MRAISWLMVGQLVQVTICDGYETRFTADADTSDTNTETDLTDFQATTTEDDTDAETNQVQFGQLGLEHQDVVIGRVYSYDYSVKLLILSKSSFNLIEFVVETVHNPGTPEETYADSVMINARNIKNVEILE